MALAKQVVAQALENCVEDGDVAGRGKLKVYGVAEI
jgi:hypothetical protein